VPVLTPARRQGISILAQTLWGVSRGCPNEQLYLVGILFVTKNPEGEILVILTFLYNYWSYASRNKEHKPPKIRKFRARWSE
jgi:hypothetical protein